VSLWTTPTACRHGPATGFSARLSDRRDGRSADRDSRHHASTPTLPRKAIDLENRSGPRAAITACVPARRRDRNRDRVRPWLIVRLARIRVRNGANNRVQSADYREHDAIAVAPS
jgi:hypothetical protein